MAVGGEHAPDSEARIAADEPPHKKSRLSLEQACPLPTTIPSSGPEAVATLRHIRRVLAERPFGLWLHDCQWSIKRVLYGFINDIVAVAEKGEQEQLEVVSLLDQLLRSGYAQTARDRCLLVGAGAWKPMIDLLLAEKTAGSGPASIDSIVRMYVHLAEHVNFYDDFAGTHPEFWDPKHFRMLLTEMPRVMATIPDSVEADVWEMICPDLEAALKTFGSFMLFWTNSTTDAPFTFDLAEAMPLLTRILDVLGEYDARFGKEISAKNRGDPLEEIVRLGGVLAHYVTRLFDEAATNATDGPRKQAVALLGLLVRVLALPIPTCGPKSEGGAKEAVPVDERQLDSDWIENLWEYCQISSKPNDEFLDPTLLPHLFKVMATLPLEEQKYRLESISPLVSSFIGKYGEQLKQKQVPSELSDLKTVLNMVLQDDVGSNTDFMEELCFYPCLLEFATKRAILQSHCERLKLHSGNGDPIRLVVPRDNVLDGVCSSLHLEDKTARIEVPVEIEFRAGYADDTGKELVDEGEDQGGLRRQWLDRASRHFVCSDLFMSPAEDAAHLERSTSSDSKPAAQGRGRYVVPSAESVCRCVQEDWEEQFELFGCILGFALLYNETVPVHFGHNFLRSAFGLKTEAADMLPLLESVDKTLHTKVKYILDGSYSTLGESLDDALEQSHLPNVFAMRESHCPELVESTPLKEGGVKIRVTEENKEEFVMLLIEHVLISGVAKQVECFRRGLLRVLPDELLQRIAELMSLKEIELMVCGVDEVDVSDWEEHTQYENGYTRDSQPVRWFWETVRGMSQSHQASLLAFATGSSQVPSGGFRFLQPELFTIQRVAVTDRCPEAHTCANCIDLPEYESKEELERKLLFAIEETGDAFGRR